MKNKFTQSVVARHIAGINRLAAGAMMHFAEGMWNPDFCSSDDTGYAESVCEDIEARIKALRNYINLQNPTRDSGVSE